MTETIVRSFQVALARAGADQRTLGGRCVPYLRPATVSDDGIHAYREMFAPGAFGRQLNAARRIPLKYAHNGGVLDTVGRATQLEEQEDGLFGMFRVFEGIVGDQALTLVDEGILPGLSVSGVPIKTSRNADGVVVRERVHLSEISLGEEPAYADALVSMRRSRLPADRPERPDQAQLDRLARVGIKLG
jgi:HK97 family phage prohead protease